MKRNFFAASRTALKKHSLPSPDVGQKRCGPDAYRGSSEPSAIDCGQWQTLRTHLENANKAPGFRIVSQAVGSNSFWGSSVGVHINPEPFPLTGITMISHGKVHKIGCRKIKKTIGSKEWLSIPDIEFSPISDVAADEATESLNRILAAYSGEKQ